MAKARPVRWLHLSDLHLGCRGQELWWQVQEAFEGSVRAVVGEQGAPDLILLSGDLTFRGAKDEFDQVDRFLDDLLGWIREAAPGASEPLLLAVPGNHDLVRPQGRAAWTYRVLDRLVAGTEHPDVEQLNRELWETRDASFIAELFPTYCTWWERRVRPGLASSGKVALQVSHFPGDFTAEIALDGICPLAVVGLNSTWQQYREGEDFEEHLHLPACQFQAALPAQGKGSPLAVFKRHPRALLMLHQPPGWLSAGRAQGALRVDLPTRPLRPLSLRPPPPGPKRELLHFGRPAPFSLSIALALRSRALRHRSREAGDRLHLGVARRGGRPVPLAPPPMGSQRQ